jgi:hypothetical protein
LLPGRRWWWEAAGESVDALVHEVVALQSAFGVRHGTPVPELVDEALEHPLKHGISSRRGGIDEGQPDYRPPGFPDRIGRVKEQQR